MQLSNRPVPHNGAFTVAEAAAWKPGTIFSAASRGVATYNSQEYYNSGWKGLRLIIDANDVGTGGTLDVKIQGKDHATGEWYDVPGAAATQITVAAAGATFTLYPGVTEDSGVDEAQPLPVSFRVVATVGTDTVNFSVSGELLA